MHYHIYVPVYTQTALFRIARCFHKRSQAISASRAIKRKYGQATIQKCWWASACDKHAKCQ